MNGLNKPFMKKIIISWLTIITGYLIMQTVVSEFSNWHIYVHKNCVSLLNLFPVLNNISYILKHQCLYTANFNINSIN